MAGRWPIYSGSSPPSSLHRIFFTAAVACHSFFLRCSSLAAIMVRHHPFHPSLTPPPDYWDVVGEKPPVPPKSDRRRSSFGGSYQVLTAIPSLPPAPPRYFPLRPYETPIKPIPRSPREVPQSLQITPLEPTKSRGVSSPTVIPASPTPSIRSLNSESSSASSTASTPARYRHRANARSNADNSGSQALNSFPSNSTLFSTSSGRPRRLRRMPSPPREGLRAIRAKESEACLKAAYDRQLNAYLDGSIALGAFGMGGLAGIEE